ncbi:hypothetical protein KSS87_001552, partial [Heliosperma pusillum]
MNPIDIGVDYGANDRAEGAYEASFRFIDELTSNCDDVQAKVLAEILSRNLETEYLKRHDLSKDCMDRETFKSKVPVISYDDIKHDIERIYNGDLSPILTTQPISEIWVSGGLPFVSVQYSSSECDLGFNLNPMCDPYDISYTIMPNMAYYEFLPLESESDDEVSGSQLEPVDMANVELGQEYELVVTTYTGLYRYRVGDVLIPTGFYNSTPQFKILKRKNVVLSIDADKTTETELQKAIEKASKILDPFNTIIYEYTSNANIKIVPGHYVIYLELMTNDQSNEPGSEVIEQCCLAMEDVLGSVYRVARLDESIGPLEIRVIVSGHYVIYLELMTNDQSNEPGSEVIEQCCLAMEDVLGSVYQVARLDESIGPLEIRVVRNGSFEKVRNYAISKGACLNQFKIP